jgi:hypothetical protein
MSGFPFLTFLSRMHFSHSPSLAVLFRWSCSDCPVLTVLFWLSWPCGPVLDVLSWKSFPGCRVLTELSWQFFLGYPVPTVLSRLSCSGCSINAIRILLSCRGFLVWLPCYGSSVLTEVWKKCLVRSLGAGGEKQQQSINMYMRISCWGFFLSSKFIGHKNYYFQKNVTASKNGIKKLVPSKKNRGI